MRGDEEGGDAGCLGARQAAGGGEGEAALGRVEMGVLREGELGHMSEGRAGGWVVEGPDGILLRDFWNVSRRAVVRCAHASGRVNGVGKTAKSSSCIMYLRFEPAARTGGAGSVADGWDDEAPEGAPGAPGGCLLIGARAKGATTTCPVGHCSQPREGRDESSCSLVDNRSGEGGKLDDARIFEECC